MNMALFASPFWSHKFEKVSIFPTTSEDRNRTHCPACNII